MKKAIEFYGKALMILQEIGDKRSEGKLLNNIGEAFENENKHKEAMACYLLAKEIYIQIEDPELKTTELNLKRLEENLGRKKFEMLLAEVAPRAKDIVKKEKERDE
jgi:tetratricopeptide (TPR) repeat protein